MYHVLPSPLFKVCIEIVFQKILNEEVWIKVGDTLITRRRYAHDTLLTADKASRSQNMLVRVNKHSQKYALEMNKSKTKQMVIYKRHYILAKLKEHTYTHRFLKETD